MARPRVFVSSTFYDLKHIRSSLDIFIESMGYDSILSEKGDVAYAPDVPLDQSCYREVETADIFVLIVGGRYGSAAQSQQDSQHVASLDRYESVTKLEHDHAAKRDIPIYILVESAVYAEYLTYQRNRNAKQISYAHVDSKNVFEFLDAILARKRNNPIQTFDRFADIERWLREQWAGLFREFLNRRSSQKQLTTLSGQVETLQQVTETLKRYLEELLVQEIAPDKSKSLIDTEKERLKSSEQDLKLRENEFVQTLLVIFDIDFTSAREAISSASSFEDLVGRLKLVFKDPDSVRMLTDQMHESGGLMGALNLAREILGKKPLHFVKLSGTEANSKLNN